jgi:hypothetical protein
VIAARQCQRPLAFLPNGILSKKTHQVKFGIWD